MKKKSTKTATPDYNQPMMVINGGIPKEVFDAVEKLVFRVLDYNGSEELKLLALNTMQNWLRVAPVTVTHCNFSAR